MSKPSDRTIHDFSFDMITEYFSMLDRQGPGSEEATLKALGFVEKLGRDAKIADLGCGTGGQTVTLAQNTSGTITALDRSERFIGILKNRLGENSLEGRVNCVVGSMDNLAFDKQSLDLIWSEGAIYIMGFKRGLCYWRQFLKPGGFVAVTEATWLTQSPSPEIADFWSRAYPDIDTMPVKLAQLHSAGYTPIASFVLPDYCWTDNFYTLQQEA